MHDLDTNEAVQISELENQKELGVIIESKLKFDEQIADRVKKANGILALIRRTIKYIDAVVFKTLYKSLVGPILEYAGSIWYPHLVQHRKRRDMILVYKILNDYIDCNSSIFFMLNTSY